MLDWLKIFISPSQKILIDSLFSIDFDMFESNVNSRTETHRVT